MSSRFNGMAHSPVLVQKTIELGKILAESSLGPTILDLVDIRASQLNGCAFCLDMHVKEAKIHGERELRLHHVSIWRESNLFSEKERAALDWTEALTRIGPHGVSDEVFQKVRQVFSEKEISDLTFAVGVINLWNRLNVASRSIPGSLDAALGLTQAGLS